MNDATTTRLLAMLTGGCHSVYWLASHFAPGSAVSPGWVAARLEELATAGLVHRTERGHRSLFDVYAKGAA